MQATEKIWMNGELVDWADATVHVGTHALHYGSGVFEGIRTYETERGPAVFRLTDHIERLARSAKLMYMDLPYTVDELRRACLDVVAANGLPACYLRPVAYFGYGELGLYPLRNPVDVFVMCWPWGTYLGEEALRNGVRAKISSWKRVGPNTIPHVAKACGIYLNSILAKIESAKAGYEEGILLTDEGYVADCTGENIFVVRDGRLVTPPLSTSILVGVTRDTVIQLARALGYEVVEEPIIRTDLYLADEVFVTGTAAEVTPVRSVDDQEIGPPGPVTEAIQAAFFEVVRGRDARFSHWLEFVPKSSVVPGS